MKIKFDRNSLWDSLFENNKISGPHPVGSWEYYEGDRLDISFFENFYALTNKTEQYNIEYLFDFDGNYYGCGEELTIRHDLNADK